VKKQLIILSLLAIPIIAILIKQQKVEGVVYLISIIILTIIVVLSLWGVGHFNDDMEGLSVAFAVLAVMLGTILIIILVIFLITGLPHQPNPEYGALKDILRTITPIS
jgi:hypothetical protein